MTLYTHRKQLARQPAPTSALSLQTISQSRQTAIAANQACQARPATHWILLELLVEALYKLFQWDVLALGVGTIRPVDMALRNESFMIL